MDAPQMPPTNPMNALVLSSSQTWGLTTKKNCKGEERSPSERLQDLGIPIASNWQQQLHDQIGLIALLLTECNFWVTTDVLVMTIRPKDWKTAFFGNTWSKIKSSVYAARNEFNKEKHGAFSDFKTPKDGKELIETLAAAMNIINERLEPNNIEFHIGQFLTSLESRNYFAENTREQDNRDRTLHKLRQKYGIPTVYPPPEGSRGKVLRGERKGVPETSGNRSSGTGTMIRGNVNLWN